MKFIKPLFWNSKNIISIILFPLSLITLIINEMKELSSKKKFLIKTICVGNTYLGGTGKTSLAIKIQTLFNRVLKENLSVRKTEQIVKKINKGSKINNNSQIKTASIVKDEKLLSGLLATKIEVSNKNNHSGHIKILFKSDEDRARIIDIIKTIKKIK